MQKKHLQCICKNELSNEAKHLRKKKQRIGILDRQVSARQDALLSCPKTNEEECCTLQTLVLEWPFLTHLQYRDDCVHFHTSNWSDLLQESILADSVFPSSHKTRELVRSLHLFARQCLTQLILRSLRMSMDSRNWIN